MAKIFVIAGHGAGDPGATGNGYTEAERVRALATRIKEIGGDNVMLGDMNRNYYKDNGISYLTIPKDYQIVEFHMDSGSPSARGGHVIIKSGFSPDSYDNALATFISSMLPGRSKAIVGRSDLANVNRAAAKGYGYRLVECGFISNATDVGIFNSKMDEIAKGILGAFGITPKGEWVKDNKGWWWKNADGSYPANAWQKINGEWYYFDERGYMVTGWKQINGVWYYLDESGKMHVGWLNLGGTWYYLNGSGAMVTGIQTINGSTYYFAPDGHMCVTNESGALV